MNKTKRKIFETSMKLFAEKGYDATSIEEITANVGVAKGTLYYHFSSKEEIFQFLIEEGVKLLKNSVEIKTEKLEKSLFPSMDDQLISNLESRNWEINQDLFKNEADLQDKIDSLLQIVTGVKEKEDDL